MRASVFAFLAAASVVSAQSSTIPAPQITDSPSGAGAYIATLPEKAGSTVRGSISAESAADGKGVKFFVSFSGIPETGGPFMYHIHEKPVPENGNCTAAGAHLDPYKRGEVPICDASQPETCQVGDLSGKFGNATAAGLFEAEYTDLFTSLNPSSPAYFGNLSFVFHFSNKTRIGCANFRQVGTQPPSVASSLPAPSATGFFNGTATITPTPPPAEFTGAAVKVAGGAGAMLAAAAVFVL
ncbi:superoxide dismutase [Ampelomyces quisqualis]|uniref:superoxide dismutase n=1 Tax=Ampelomyces quisqualis TaxID=50730 RepID=A0A6A5QIA2_AMPQU|nr:superoxide dismutase [Ampelomyces quisqualis]